MNLVFADRSSQDAGVRSRVALALYSAIATASSSLIASALVLSLVVVPSKVVRAQGQYDTGITVEGSGESKAVPDIVEINLKLSAKAELSDDAVIKHRDAKKRAIETFEALKMPNLQIEEKELGLRAAMNMFEMQQIMWGNMPMPQNKRTQVEVGSTLRARLTGVDKLSLEELMSSIGKLLDAAQDSGGNLGMSESDVMLRRYWGWGMQQNSLVKFVVSNAKELRENAYMLAVKDARNRAERLARLANAKVGAVQSLQDYGANQMNNFNYYYYAMSEENDPMAEKDEITAETMSGGKIRIKVRARFALDPIPAGDQAQATVAGEKK